MKRLQQTVLIIFFVSTVSYGQTPIDTVLSSFKAALESSKKSYQDTFEIYRKRNSTLLEPCKNRIKFYKSYSNYHYDNYRDDKVLVLQKDSILPLQRSCLSPDHDEITTTLLNVARSYLLMIIYQGKDFYSEAEKYFLEVSNRLTKSEIISDRFSKRYREIADFYDIKRDYKKAVLYYDRALEIYTGSSKTVEYIELLMGKAKNLTKTNEYAEAIRILNRTIKLANSDINKFKKELSLSHHRLALAYRSESKLELAEGSILKARNIASIYPEIGSRNTIQFASRHGAILKSAGKYTESIKVYLEVKELNKKLGSKIKLSDVSGLNENIADVYYEQGDLVKALEMYHLGVSTLVSVPAKGPYFNPTIKRNRIIDKRYLHRQLGLKARAHLALAKKSEPKINYSSTLDAILKYDTLGQELLKQNWEEDSHQLRIRELSPFYLMGIQSAVKLYELTGNKKHLYSAHQISSRYKGQLLHRGISIKERKKEVLSDSLLAIEKKYKKNISTFEKEYVVDLATETDTKESLQNYLNEKTRLDKFYLDHNISDIIDNSISAASVSIEDFGSELRDNSAILEYFVAEDEVHSFLITNKDIHHRSFSLNIADLQGYLNYLNSEENQKENLNVSSQLLGILSKVDNQVINKLIIIPDGNLLQLPFEALRWNDKYLLESFDVSYEYSTGFLLEKEEGQSNGSYLGFGSDYTLEDNDTTTNFTPLPYAIKEIESAKEIYGGTINMNSAANKVEFESLSEKAKIIHLALHSQLNSSYPDQSALVFQSDSSYQYLTASEIYNLDLDSDLTVLSACNTAVGQINPGDGVRSITRSFIHAGSKSVLTTLWEAPDISTSQIVDSFYKELENGSSKDAALRKAKQLYILGVQPSYRHPKYWAHLVLVGDTSPMTLGNLPLGRLWLVLSVAALIFIFFFLKFRTRS